MRTPQGRYVAQTQLYLHVCMSKTLLALERLSLGRIFLIISM